MEEICKKCGAISKTEELVTEMKEFKNGTLHKIGHCPHCKSYLRPLPQGGPPKLYFGKYKDQLIKDVAIKDRDYLEWLADWAMDKNPKLEKQIADTLWRIDHGEEIY